MVLDLNCIIGSPPLSAGRDASYEKKNNKEGACDTGRGCKGNVRDRYRTHSHTHKHTD